VKITSDGNLACKLEALSGQAEAKLKQMAEDEAKESSISNALAVEKKVSLSRKTSEDLPASEYYKIYQQSKKHSNSIQNNVEPLEEALDMETKTEVKVQGGGIAERLAALKKNGEENWKKKIPKVAGEAATKSSSTIEELSSSAKKTRETDDDDDAANISRTSNNELLDDDLDNNGNNSGDQEILNLRENNDNNQDQNNSTMVVENEVVQLRKKSDRPGGKVGSLQERLSQLQSAQTSWQNKVAQKDMEKYTVAGKMSSSTPTISSSNAKIPDKMAATPTKRTSRKESEMNAMNNEITANTSNNSNDAPAEDNPNKDDNKKRKKKTPTMRRFHGSPPPASDKSYDEAAPSEVSEVFYSEVVEVPDLDEDLDKFLRQIKTLVLSLHQLQQLI
jgi:hypothetical protein